MNLHDPLRPKILHRPAFLSGWYVIPRLQLWPKENGKIELSLMLPIQDQRFSGKWYSITVREDEISDMVLSYGEDPEAFVLLYFSLDIMKLDHTIPTPNTNQTSCRPNTPILSVTALLGQEE